MRLIGFLKDWALIIAIAVGIAAYFVYVNIPFLEPTKAAAAQTISVIQPVLIFSMLFLTYCKTDLRNLRFCRWHLWLLLIQCGVFTAIGCLLMLMPHSGLRVVLEGAMLCMICPTATAGAVITRRLGGNVSNITTYTILINLATALLIPALVPFVHPNPDLTPWTAAALILGKVFPLLLLPLLAAVILKKTAPKLTERIARYQDLSFYLWAVALALAMTVTTRSIVHSEVALSTQLWLVVVSLLSCGLQFWLGRKIGARYNDTVTAGQSFGQKNTVLAIWMGYTFFTPVTAVVGGFYSIWHNLVNSWQLYEHKRAEQAIDTPADKYSGCRPEI
ncbi:MAG: transporter [Muribaculaceae bacterium]|nr:transporter [Muribaculaceae bacterium]